MRSLLTSIDPRRELRTSCSSSGPEAKRCRPSCRSGGPCGNATTGCASSPTPACTTRWPPPGWSTSPGRQRPTVTRPIRPRTSRRIRPSAPSPGCATTSSAARRPTTRGTPRPNCAPAPPTYVLVGALAAGEAAGVPLASPVTTIYPLPAEGAPPFGPGFAPARGPLGRLRDKVFASLMVRPWAKGLPAVNAARTGPGPPPVATVTEAFERLDRILVLSPRSLDHESRHFPPNVRHVGARPDDPARAGDRPHTAPPCGKPRLPSPTRATRRR